MFTVTNISRFYDKVRDWYTYRNLFTQKYTNSLHSSFAFSQIQSQYLIINFLNEYL